MATEASAPASAEDLRNQILARHDALSSRLRQIARYVLDEPNDVAFETLAVIAARSKVQPSAIVRFAQAFGFKGASQMQRLLRDDLLANDESIGYAERIRHFSHSVAAQTLDGPGQLLDEFVKGNILALNNLNHAVGQKDLHEAVDLIQRCETAYIVGFRRAFPVASYLGYLLAQANKRVVFVDGVAGLARQQTHALLPNDLVIAISFHPYAPETIEIVEKAVERGSKVLAISDSVISPIAKDASLVLQVRESEIRGFRSLAASMCLVQALSICYAVAQTQSEAEKEEAAASVAVTTEKRRPRRRAAST